MKLVTFVGGATTYDAGKRFMSTIPFADN